MSDYTWKDETKNALAALGGVAHLNEIFNKIVERGNIDMSNAKTPKRTLSRTLQTYSNSTDYGIDNIFYSIYGVEKRKGIWGLRNYVTTVENVDLTQDDAEYAEGKMNFRKHIIRERNQELIFKAKQGFKERNNGDLFCEVCGFNFEKVYGEIGENFIEAHHIKPVSEMKDGENTNINDIVMLCSNCHSMIHRKKPWVTKEKLKNIIE